MRLRIKQPEKDNGRGCSICRGKENLMEFYDLDDNTLSFCLCYDCIKALYSTCVDSYMFETSKMACIDTDSESFKAGYREGYRDGFKDNYELKD